MVKILGIYLHWGKTRHMHMHFPSIDRTWETSLYGISIRNTFLGIMVRGKRITEKPKTHGWGSGVDRMSGAYDDSEILQSQEWH